MSTTMWMKMNKNVSFVSLKELNFTEMLGIQCKYISTKDVLLFIISNENNCIIFMCEKDFH